jgi:hypothetical protein
VYCPAFKLTGREQAVPDADAAQFGDEGVRSALSVTVLEHPVHVESGEIESAIDCVEDDTYCGERTLDEAPTLAGMRIEKVADAVELLDEVCNGIALRPPPEPQAVNASAMHTERPDIRSLFALITVLVPLRCLDAADHYRRRRDHNAQGGLLLIIIGDLDLARTSG